MRRLLWLGSFTIVTALVATLSATAAADRTDNVAPVTPEAGARLCGYIIMPLLQSGAVLQNLSIMVEVPEGDSFLCDKALPEIRDEIKNNKALAGLRQYYKDPQVRITGEQINPTTAGNKWVYFTTATCENVGKSFGGQVGSNDICESGHPKKGMNRLSKADGTYHAYTWTYAFYSQDPTTGAVLDCAGKPASETKAQPCKLEAPLLNKMTTSKKAPW